MVLSFIHITWIDEESNTGKNLLGRGNPLTSYNLYVTVVCVALMWCVHLSFSCFLHLVFVAWNGSGQTLFFAKGYELWLKKCFCCWDWDIGLVMG